jgi:hypothetical protein
MIEFAFVLENRYGFPSQGGGLMDLRPRESSGKNCATGRKSARRWMPTGEVAAAAVLERE